MNRQIFYARIRETVAGGRLLAAQVTGIEAILDQWDAVEPKGDLRQLAYMLATAWHETAATMQPVRETLARSDDAAIAILRKAYRAGKLPHVKKPYWERDRDGKSWLGRGLVQLTHKRNYLRLGRAIGLDLIAEPALAMDRAVAVKILFAGMAEGLFTGRKLSDHFNAVRSDWTGARRIITGPESMERVADLGRAFHEALVAATAT
ncbi:glycoside hydrolase family 19 protein [Rhizobium alvei]|uniref:Glycoside hydrolase family 19 protein n=1 Tax=Rhizobium alvei TaxID=1132659 RepID=A0ABT8YU76_9HYPH|nr:glycoside hydrolase family 19 protein [Rhizobium alvei]MDO6967101.1 glycoside hydrolase family 19 protein [Rhizobium alvei]